MDCLAAFHCGEVVTSVQRAALQVLDFSFVCMLLFAATWPHFSSLFCNSHFSQAGGSEAVVYSGILGTVGALVPFTTRDDVDFFTHLEMCVTCRSVPCVFTLVSTS